jgi:flagellar hook-basal body complex protein FliE
MSQFEIDNVLSQIRSLRAQAGGGLKGIEQPSSVAGVANPTPKVSFASVLKSGLDEVSKQQSTASSTALAFQRGVPGVDLPRVMIEMQKSSIAFRGAVEVRNRMISAYQDIMNMPV